MDMRVSELINSLGLAPHPEGGHYREIYRSPSRVRPLDGRPERAALTTIYFLLAQGEVSRWHRVGSDEVWHWYEGAPLELFTADDHFTTVSMRRLGPADDETQPVAVVPAMVWQAARSIGTYTLVGCTVGPGFDFEDFEMLETLPSLVAIAGAHPEARLFFNGTTNASTA
jgi:predicted cupin superfamily sugar epimerase